MRAISLPLARCIASAASVSDCCAAMWSKSVRAVPGRKKLSQRLTRLSNSKGVAQVDAAAFAVGRGENLRCGARPVEVDVGVEMFAVKGIDCIGVLRADVREAHVLANDRAVLGFDQAIVAGVSGARLGLFHQ